MPLIKILILSLLFTFSTSWARTNIVVPTTAGGAVDTLARKFAEFAELRTGKSFTIENIGGAGGNIGLDKFIKSRPNTLMITSGSWYLSINSGKFDLEDFRPISILAEAPFFIAVNKSQKFTCEKFKSPTNKLFLGSAALSHTEIISKMIIQKYPHITNVPYKAIKPATLELLGNHIQAVIIGSATDIVEPLLMMANSTSSIIDGIPSFNECLGINNPITMDFILMTNSTSDQKFIDAIQTLVLEFVKDPEIQNYYKDNYMYFTNTGVTKIKPQLQRWKDLAK